MMMRALLTLLLSLFVMPALAEVQFDGYITQGWVKTDHNDYFGHSSSKGGSLQFNEVGVAATATLSDNLLGSAAVVARNAGGTDTGDIRVDYAHLLYDFAAGDWNGQLAVGRNKIDFGLFNSTRDVANTRPSILLPQSYYFDNARKYLINADGLQLKLSRPLKDSVLTLSAAYQQTVGVDNPETKAYFLGYNFPGHLNAEPSTHLSIDWASQDTELKAYYGIERKNYSPASTDYLPSGHIDATAWWLSAKHTAGDYTFIGELFIPTLQYQGFAPLIANQTVIPRGGYIQAGKVFGSNFEGFVRRDIMYLNWKDRSGQAFAATTGRPAYDAYAYDTTVGGRWHIDGRQSFSAEWHHVSGTGWLPLEDAPANHQKDWNMLLLQYSINF